MTELSEAPVPIVPTQGQEFIVGKVGSRYFRFSTFLDVPEGIEVDTLESLTKAGKERVVDLYASIVGVQPKNYKTMEIAIDSLAYQIKKLPTYNASEPAQLAPVSGTGVSAASVDRPPAVKKERAAKGAEVFELLSPPEDAKVVNTLAPQAKELVAMMVEFAKLKGSRSFGASEFEEHISGMAARLKTRQLPSRILLYYKSKLETCGLLKVTR